MSFLSSIHLHSVLSILLLQTALHPTLTGVSGGLVLVVLPRRAKDTEAETIPNGDLNPERKIVQGRNPSPGSDLATKATERSPLRNLFCYLFPIPYQKRGRIALVEVQEERGEKQYRYMLKRLLAPKGLPTNKQGEDVVNKNRKEGDKQRVKGFPESSN